MLLARRMLTHETPKKCNLERQRDGEIENCQPRTHLIELTVWKTMQAGYWSHCYHSLTHVLTKNIEHAVRSRNHKCEYFNLIVRLSMGIHHFLFFYFSIFLTIDFRMQMRIVTPFSLCISIKLNKKLFTRAECRIALCSRSGFVPFTGDESGHKMN